ncbi:MAG: hypothetical protein ACRC6T_13245 [Sarcina sp.]
MEIFYPEDFNTLFGRGSEEELPKKVNVEVGKNIAVNALLEDDTIECISKEKKPINHSTHEELKRGCPCEDKEEDKDEDGISAQRKPMELPPKTAPPKTSDYVVNQKKIGAADYPTYAVSPEALSVCLNKLTYIWQNNNKEYWAYIFYIDHVSYVGWRWNQYINDWVYFGIDISKIESFTCKR